MTAPSLATLFALAALLLAGCVEEAADDGPVTEDALAGDVALPTLPTPGVPTGDPDGVPLWAVGDWWTFTTPDGEASTVVVTSATGATYVTAAAANQTAAYDAMFDISYIGPITKADLAGRQGDTPVKFFQFPLVDGASWTTVWDGLDVTITAKRIPTLQTPLGASPGFELTAVAGNHTHATYTYSPLVKWWTRLAFADDDYALALSKAGSGFVGEVFQGEGRLLYSISGSAVAAGAGDPTFTVSADATHLIAQRTVAGDAAASPLRLVAPSGAVVTFEPDYCHPCTVQDFRDLPVEAGEWRVAHAYAATGESTLVVREAAIVAKAFP